MSGLYGLLAMGVFVVAVLGVGDMVRDQGLAWRFEQELGTAHARAPESPRRPESAASGPRASR